MQCSDGVHIVQMVNYLSMSLSLCSALKVKGHWCPALQPQIKQLASRQITCHVVCKYFFFPILQNMSAYIKDWWYCQLYKFTVTPNMSDDLTER